MGNTNKARTCRGGDAGPQGKDQFKPAVPDLCDLRAGAPEVVFVVVKKAITQIANSICRRDRRGGVPANINRSTIVGVTTRRSMQSPFGRAVPGRRKECGRYQSSSAPSIASSSSWGIVSKTTSVFIMLTGKKCSVTETRGKSVRSNVRNQCRA
jgi:hypothetical protein